MAAIVAGAVGVSPGAAQAAWFNGTAWVSSAGNIRYNVAPHQQNRVVITRSGRTVTVDDRVAVRAGKGCQRVKGDRTRVRCTIGKKPTRGTVDLGDRSDTLTNRTDLRLYVYGGTGNDTVTGGSGRDVLQGDSGNDRLSGGGGNDFIPAGAGNDIIHGNAGDDFILGEEGHDRVYGDAGGDALSGGDGNDSLWGGPGYDQLMGDAGFDVIDRTAEDDPSSRP